MRQGHILTSAIRDAGVTIAASTDPPKRPDDRLKHWLLEHRIEDVPGPEAKEGRSVLLATLGAVFLRGFEEAIGIAVVVVGAYLLLNLVVVAVGLYECVVNPANVADWQSKLFANYGNPLTMLGVSLLGSRAWLSGFRVSRPA